MADYIIQKAVEPSKVKKKLQRTLEVYGETFEAQPKKDGCCAIIGDYNAVKPGYYTAPARKHITASRTGEVYPCLDDIADWLATALPGLVLIGEAWWPGKDQFNLISGEFRRLERSSRLQFVINDALTEEEFAAGVSKVPYRERMERLAGLPDHPRCYVTQRLPAGRYGPPQDLCNMLVAQGGHDGLILRDPEGLWEVGRGTTGEILKIKQVLSFDLRVLEVNTETGEKTGRTVYKLVVDFMGKRLGVGSGLPHDFDRVPKVGDIVEVEAMDYSSDGLLREPRYKGIRFDKIEADAA